MIHMEHVHRRFGRFVALADVTLDVARGESVALWGGNGAGKSTLIRCVLGLHRFQGRISVDGLDVLRHGKETRGRIGYVPQELGFYDDLRAAEALCFFARLKGIRRLDAAVALDAVGLAAHGRKRIRELSGGMKQRLALAVALLGDPPLLIMDEVTASLDVMGRRELVALLAGLRQGGRTLLFASHRPEEIAGLADRCVVMKAGRVELECDPQCVLEEELAPLRGAAPPPRAFADHESGVALVCGLAAGGAA